jgi:hypothetical protein
MEAALATLSLLGDRHSREPAPPDHFTPTRTHDLLANTRSFSLAWTIIPGVIYAMAGPNQSWTGAVAAVAAILTIATSLLMRWERSRAMRARDGAT